MCSAQIIRLPAVPPSETRCLHWQCTHKLTDSCTSSRLWTQALDCELLPQSVPLPELFERLSGHTCRRSVRAINGKKRPEIHVSQAHNAHAVLDKALCAAVTYYTHDSLPPLVADSCHAVIDLPRSMSSGLKAFILRTEVITLYRNFCKAVRQAPDHTKGTCTCPAQCKLVFPAYCVHTFLKPTC